MADKKVSELTELTSVVGRDELYIVDDPAGTPVSKKVQVNSLFSSVAANTSFAGTVAAANGIMTLGKATSVTSNNTTTLLGAGLQGSIFWDTSYLYVAVSNTVVKRVALSDFDS
jgi:hypothetical protein